MWLRHVKSKITVLKSLSFFNAIPLLDISKLKQINSDLGQKMCQFIREKKISKWCFIWHYFMSNLVGLQLRKLFFVIHCEIKSIHRHLNWRNNMKKRQCRNIERLWVEFKTDWTLFHFLLLFTFVVVHFIGNIVHLPLYMCLIFLVWVTL